VSNEKWLSSGNLMLDQILKNGISHGQVNMIIGKPRQMGNSYYNMKYMTWFKAQKRKESIKSILNI
jgi:hypothetical protein